ncbi:GIY-YIG nuclease family protein [Candidatus Bathyarchaeota archaeon]|nr:GIY-YIG nuclease family protein [Candidatus Bathyarchaeota archaeon]
MVKGVYVLAISVCRDAAAEIGALGLISFRKGIYAYVGSAQKGLESRLRRHFRKRKREFWHIDYLLSKPQANIVDVFYKEGGKREECRAAEMLAEESGFAVRGFGCSDCNCKSHLFFFENVEKLERICLALDFVPLSRQRVITLRNV